MWRRIARELCASGALTPLTRDLVARYCELEVVIERAYGYIDQGLLVPGRRERLVANPAWRIYRDAVEQQRALARELGFVSATSTNRPRTRPST